MMKKIFFILLLFSISCGKPSNQPDKKPLVLVSIAPYRFLVEQIAQGTLEVQSVVPPNTNPHAFEPTSRQATKIAEGCIWFRIGEPFEDKIIPFLKERNPHLITYDLREGIELIAETDNRCTHCSKDHLDRHIWLSPKLTVIQAENIEKILSAQWTENQEFFKKNLEQLKTNLFQLDAEIASLLKPLKNRTLLVSHPAFGYFCKEYGLKQLSVEYEGKDPRPRHLEKILMQAQTNGLKTAITLPQYNNKGTLLIAEKLKVETKMIDPYSADYIATLQELAEMISQ